MKVCSSNKLSQELKLIKKFASWNDFSKYIVNSIFRNSLQAHEDKSEPNVTAKQKEHVVIYLRFPYYEDKGLQLLKSWIRKIQVPCKTDQPVVFMILYNICKMEFLIYLLNITRLGPALFSNDIGNAGNRNSRTNLVIDNTNIIDRCNNFNILFFFLKKYFHDEKWNSESKSEYIVENNIYHLVIFQKCICFC